jgi:hypothetical protein
VLLALALLMLLSPVLRWMLSSKLPDIVKTASEPEVSGDKSAK